MPSFNLVGTTLSSYSSDNGTGTALDSLLSVSGYSYDPTTQLFVAQFTDNSTQSGVINSLAALSDLSGTLTGSASIGSPIHTNSSLSLLSFVFPPTPTPTPTPSPNTTTTGNGGSSGWAGTPEIFAHPNKPKKKNPSWAGWGSGVIEKP